MWCRNSRKVRYLLILKMWSTQVIDESSSTKLCVSIRQASALKEKKEGGREGGESTHEAFVQQDNRHAEINMAK